MAISLQVILSITLKQSTSKGDVRMAKCLSKKYGNKG